MKKISQKHIDSSGRIRRCLKDMKSLLNYNILNLLNKTRRTGWLDLPVIHCNTDIIPSFLALYKEKALYNKTDKTAVCFYSYDNEFDGKYGLFWAIYHNDIRRLEYFKLRFRNVKIFITPDYSIFNDIHKIENLIRIWKARLITLWLTIELKAIVIPNASYTDEKDFPINFCGLEECGTIAFSIKSHFRCRRERKLCENAIKYVVDNFKNLKTIIVYSACGNDENCLKLFRYCNERNVKVFVPDNTLLLRNRLRWRKNHV